MAKEEKLKKKEQFKELSRSSGSIGAAYALAGELNSIAIVLEEILETLKGIRDK